MTEPLTKKINDLPEIDVVAASNDKLLMLDVSESVVNMTKLVPMSLLSIHTSSQLAANTVGSSQIIAGAVTNSKLGADAVDGAKIADNAIGNEHIRDSAALSVIGRSSNTSGNPADIAAGTDGYVLRRSGTTLGFGTVATAGIANGAVTPDKLSIPYIPNATNIELGNLRTSSGSAYIDFHPYYPLNDYDARIIATGGEAGTHAKGTLTYSAVSHVFNGDLSVSGEITGAKHVVYMQLFLPDEAIITASGRSQFFVPSYLAGGKVKQLGIGIVSASTPSVSVALGSSYGSVSGTSSTETADTLNYTLPSARTKIPINVTCGAGTAPKGLDFWFVVLK